MHKRWLKRLKIKTILFTVFILAVFGILFGIGFFLYVAKDIPSPDSIISRRVSESTKIYDRTGNTVLYDIHGEERRTIISWENIPNTVKLATLASEDTSFYSHQGLDFKGIARAFFKDITTFSISQGGSTITQQLIKKALLGDERTPSRKIREAILSIEIERRFSKDQIFWMYLNQIPYGSNAYGIEAASQTFFGIPAKDLSYAQAATLATLTKATTYYSPYGSHLEELHNQKNLVLQRMKEVGFLSEEDYNKAVNEKLEFKPPREAILAPHFVMMVRDYLTKKYGEETVTNGGLKVYTTLDIDMQKIAEETVTKYGAINEKAYRATNASMVATDPRTGQILVMVGSRDYFDIANEGNFNVALARRQPGSSFKPFTYATALEKGFTDSTILFDVKTEFNPSCLADGSQTKDQYGLACFHPRNYDGLFHGPVTMRQSLARSLNIPSVKLLYLAGIDSTTNLATRMGITTLKDNNQNFGLSLVLGGAEVKLLDMVSAYGVFGNDGVKEQPAFILKIEDTNGTVLEEYKSKKERVIEPQIARTINDILSDNQARASVFGANSSLYFPDRPVAAKTGTTQENKDAWVVGYTPSLSVGVWTGNNKNTPMSSQGAGISAAGPMWHEFIVKALKGKSVEQFADPDPVEVPKIMLDGSYVYRHQDETGQERTDLHTILYYVDKNNAQGEFPFNPDNDPQYKNWEAAIQANLHLFNISEVVTF
ncbi:MAG: transglycosylase domain-containing protein [bacterium]|nr:transglycosylase domain-containing protein [bacterium]